MILTEQQYENLNRRYFHGAKNGRIVKDDALFDYFYLSTDFLYAATYACISGREKSKVFEFRLKEGLNIFNARSKTDIISLRVGIKKANIKFFEKWYEQGLQNEDWTFLLRNENKKDRTIQVIKDLGYDGFFNYEWTEKSKTYQGIHVKNIEDKSVVGIFDIEKLKQVAVYSYDSYFEFESFAKEFDTEKLELKNYVNALKRNKPNYDIKAFALEYAKERTPFLLQKDVEDILENSKLKESEKNIYNSSARIFEKCLKNSSVKYGQFTYKLDERFILRRC